MSNEEKGLLSKVEEAFSKPENYVSVVYLDENDLEGITYQICPQCGDTLSTVECVEGCPHSDSCEDRDIHLLNGIYWCPVSKKISLKQEDL